MKNQRSAYCSICTTSFCPALLVASYSPRRSSACRKKNNSFVYLEVVFELRRAAAPPGGVQNGKVSRRPEVSLLGLEWQGGGHEEALGKAFGGIRGTVALPEAACRYRGGFF